MWMWIPRRSAQAAARRRSMASGASASGKPNFEPAWPVRMAAWVSGTTPGGARTRTSGGGAGGGVGPHAGGDAAQQVGGVGEPLEALELIEVVDHDARAHPHRLAQL